MAAQGVKFSLPTGFSLPGWRYPLKELRPESTCRSTVLLQA